MVIIYILLLAGILYSFQLYLYQKWWNKGLNVILSFEKELTAAGSEINMTETVENRKWIPLSMLKVKFQCSRHLHFESLSNSAVTDKYYRSDLFSIMPYKRVIRTLRIYCPQRGYFTIYGIDLVGVDLFFSKEMFDTRTSQTLLYVFPAPVKSKELYMAVQRISGEIITRRHEQEDPFTYRGIREYEIYDEMKAINWKATARTGDFKVNVREHTAVSSVRILMNLEDSQILKHAELLELSISICAYLLEKLLDQGIRVNLYANARDCMTGQILETEGNSDKSSLESLYKALARLNLNKETVDFEAAFNKQLSGQEGCIYTVFVSHNRHKSFQRVLSAYSGKGDFIWLCPVKEPDIDSIAGELRDKIIFIREDDQ